jgi:hypothetical protein
VEQLSFDIWFPGQKGSNYHFISAVFVLQMADFGFGTLTFQVKDLLSDLESPTPFTLISLLYLLLKMGEFLK